jgi:hypothetical protein
MTSPRFSCSGSISRHYAIRRTWETFLIDCMETLYNIYGNRSQACRSKGKTYRNTQLGELIHSITIERAPEHRVAYRGEPVGEKRGEGETSAER